MTSDRSNRRNEKTSSGQRTSGQRSPEQRTPEQRAARIAARKKRRRRRAIFLIVEIAILVVLSIVLFLWMRYGSRAVQALNEIEHIEISSASLSSNSVTEQTEEVRKGFETIAFFGVDNRSEGNYDSGNSDSMIVCAINLDTKEMNMISVYRDTVMDVDGKGMLRKCNYAYAVGGHENAINMLNRNLDLNIQDFVAVDFSGLIDCIDAVGGVEIDVTKEEIQWLNMYIEEMAEDTGRTSKYVQKSGPQTLNGMQATAYCRIRYTAGDDFMRATRQRTVISKLVDKAKECNVDQLLDLVTTLAPKVATSFDTNEIIQHAMALREYSIANTGGYPFFKVAGEYGGNINDAVVPATTETNVKKLYEELYADPAHECSETVLDISYRIQKKTGVSEKDAVEYNPLYEGSTSELNKLQTE